VHCSLVPTYDAKVGTFTYLAGIGIMAGTVALLEFRRTRLQAARNAVVLIGSFFLLLFVLGNSG
jgi:hypothetical protein